jgi:hypothetical protein
MAIGFEGARGNDSLFATPTRDPYGGDTRLKRGLGTYGGMAAQIDPYDKNKFQQGSDATHAQNYDAMAQQARQTPLQYGNANATLGSGQSALSTAMQGHGQQQDVNNVMRDAATGQAPSAAQSLAGGMMNNTARQQLAAASSAKGGPLGQMVAQRNATQQIGAQGTQNAAQLGAIRANEMATARQQWGGNVAQQRGQDLQGVGAATQLGGQYAQMAQAGQQLQNQNSQFYDRLAHDVRTGQADRGQQQQLLDEQHWQKQTDVNQHATDRDTNTLGSIIGGIAGAGAGFLSDPAAKIPMEYGNGGPMKGFLSSFGGKGFDMKMPGQSNFTSDMRAKVPLTPEPSLRERGAAGLGNAGASLSMIGRQSDTGIARPQQPLLLAGQGKAKGRPPPKGIADYMHEQQKTQAPAAPLEAVQPVDGSGLIREDPYSEGTPGDIQREDPYGSGEFFFSDPAAKREAFEAGVKHTEGTLFGQGGDPELPEYMKGRGPGIQRETPAVEPISGQERFHGTRAFPNKAVSPDGQPRGMVVHEQPMGPRDPSQARRPIDDRTSGPDYQHQSPRRRRYARRTTSARRSRPRSRRHRLPSRQEVARSARSSRTRTVAELGSHTPTSLSSRRRSRRLAR